MFVDGQFRPDLSDSTDESGYTITINDERRPDGTRAAGGLSAPYREPAQSVTQIHVKRNQRPAKPLLLMHITRARTAMKSILRTIATIWSWRRGGSHDY